MTHNDGVENINTENKQNPKVVGNVDLNNGAWGIEKEEDLFYIAAAVYFLLSPSGKFAQLPETGASPSQSPTRAEDGEK